MTGTGPPGDGDGDGIAVPELVATTRSALESVADPERAPQMAAYMRDQFAFFGVGSAPRRMAQRLVLTKLATASGDDLMVFAEACWQQAEREFQYVAADALRKHQRRAFTAQHLDQVAGLIVDKSWWDTVDSLAPHTVGPLVTRHPELATVMDAWIDGDNLWLARAAILHQLMYSEQTDADRLFAYADRRASDTDFFIRKALGWALRQYARTDPEAVKAYVASRVDRLSPLTQREALKRL